MFIKNGSSSERTCREGIQNLLQSTTLSQILAETELKFKKNLRFQKHFHLSIPNWWQRQISWKTIEPCENPRTPSQCSLALQIATRIASKFSMAYYKDLYLPTLAEGLLSLQLSQVLGGPFRYLKTILSKTRSSGVVQGASMCTSSTSSPSSAARALVCISINCLLVPNPCRHISFNFAGIKTNSNIML